MISSTFRPLPTSRRGDSAGTLFRSTRLRAVALAVLGSLLLPPPALLAQPAGKPQLTADAAGERRIVIPADWKERFPFAARFPDLGPTTRDQHLVDLAAMRFLTDGLGELDKRGERHFREPDMTAFDADLVRRPFAKSAADLFIVQAASPADQSALRQRLDELGIGIRAYVPRYGYLVRLTGDQYRQLSAWPEVFWMGLLQPAWRIAPKLDYVRQSNPRHELELSAVFEAESFGTRKVLARMLEEEEFDASAVTRRGRDWKVRLRGVAADAARLAAMPGCLWVERFAERRLLNDVARTSSDVFTGRIKNTAVLEDGPIMDVEDVWSRGIMGQGQVAGVADTGLSTGDFATLHPDFGEQGSETNPPRLVQGFERNDRDSWGERLSSGSFEGHGTHVSGTIVGNGHLSDPNLTDGVPAGYAGIAPQAGFVFQSVEDADEGFGGLDDLEDLLTQAYDAGVRVHNNSWGSEEFGVYTSDSEDVDRFTWLHKDMVLTFAAGNEGVDAESGTGGSSPDGVIDADSINSPGTAKNVITVGASESYRPDFVYGIGVDCFSSDGVEQKTWGWGWGDDYPDDPIFGDLMADQAIGLAAFSSRGPTDDGRFKPDLVAPGSAIVSTRSDFTFQGEGDCQVPAHLKDDYVALSGTSMAAPMVAGAATLVRQYYQDGWHTNASQVTQEPPTGDGFDPTSALVKATLIHGAYDMEPGQYGRWIVRSDPLKTIGFQEIPPAYWDLGTLPNNAEGYGRVDVESSLFPGSGFGDQQGRVMEVHDVTDGIASGELHEYAFSLASGADPLVVTLVWTDPPADPMAGADLVSDLDLLVTDPKGDSWFGNGINPHDDDLVNNVEQITVTSQTLSLPEERSGLWTVFVYAFNVPGNGMAGSTRQPYALLISGLLGAPGSGGPPAPDLVIPDVQPQQVRLSPGERFTLDAAVFNAGELAADATRIDYYLSDNATISVSDEKIGSEPVSAPDAGLPVSVTLTAPSEPGTWWIGACVAHVSGEYQRENQCFSPGVEIVVEAVTSYPALQAARSTAFEVAGGDLFGTAVAISGDTAAVGSPKDDAPLGDAGSVTVFERDGGGQWARGQTLTAGDAGGGDLFGMAVAIDGDTLVVGAHADDDVTFSTGSVYVFERAGASWTETAKLHAGDPDSLDFFGRAVAIDGDVLVAAAPGDDEGGTSAGAVYVFERQPGGWTQSAKLVASDSARADQFGISVAVSGATVAVGAYLDDDAGRDSGAVYLFARDENGWQERKLVAADGATYDHFGTAVAIDGDVLAIGSPGVGPDQRGAVYLFEGDHRDLQSWAQTEKRLASDAGPGKLLGQSVAVAGDTVVAGAYNPNDLFTNIGAAYVFERGAGDWLEATKLAAGDYAPGDRFGTAVAVADVAVVGAPRSDDAGPSTDSGSVYFFAPCADGDGDNGCD